VNASRRRLLIALLLPVLALRVLLPGGFMPVAEAGELRIVMCAEGLQVPTGDGGHPATEDGGACPFAHASFNAPPMQSVALVALPALEFGFVSFVDSILPATTGPPRTAAARAPPFFS
jgi:hypothetical protein